MLEDHVLRQPHITSATSATDEPHRLPSVPDGGLQELKEHSGDPRCDFRSSQSTQYI